LKILALSHDISLLNIVDYILYKDYKIVKSTSFENLDVELNSFDLIIIDLPYWEKNSNINKVLKGYNNIPIVILTEDKSAQLLSVVKNDFHVRAVLKEPLSKKELKETVKELAKKKKHKKDKDNREDASDTYIQSPVEKLVNTNDIVFFRITDLQEKRIEFISENYKKVLGLNINIGNLKDIPEENEIPFISDASPEYSLIYKLNNQSSFKVVKETGKGSFDANKYLVNVEGTIIDYTGSYLKHQLLKFLRDLLNIENSSLEISEFIRKVIHSFSQEIPKELTQLSIIFSNKDYFVNDFITTDFLVASDIQSTDKKLGEVLLFSLNNNFDDTLKDFSNILADIIRSHYQNNKNSESNKTESARLKQELSLVSNRLSQAEAAFQDKASSYDNVNELFSAAMKDFKILSSKFNRSAIIFETNADGKFLSANENYFRAVSTDRAALIGKYFDDIFENSNWQNFQFEFFNNSNQEILLKQKNKEGKAFYFSFHISREESDNGYKFVFYGKDKTEAKSLEIELGKQISEYNNKVTELIDAKKANELLWEEINTLKEEIKTKDETIKKQEKKILKADEKIELKPEVTAISENKEYNLENKEAEVIFKEDVDQKIEKAKDEIEKTEDENESIFKNLRGIDSKIGLKNAYDNIETYNEILVNFENDYTDFMKDIKGMYLVNDNEYIKSRLLTLSEESKYIGAEDLEKSAHLFHDKLADNKINNFDFELSVLGVHLSFTLESIRKYKDEYSLAEPEKKVKHTEEVKEEISPENIDSPEVFDTIVDENNFIEPEPKLSISLAPEKTEEPLLTNDEPTNNEVDDEKISEENKIIEEIKEEILTEETQTAPEIENPDTPFTILVKNLKESVQNSEDTSVLKEKLFKLKFENNDFSKIEKIEALEASIESGNNAEAITILEELQS
jgi:HPt (histidine-containing phosphotransfer) domain-containing protein/PAS domain-containing protein